MKKLIVLFVASILSISLLSAKDYKVDMAHSQVAFKIKHLSISNVTGNFGDFSGMISANKGKLTALSGEVNIDSINTNNEKRDAHIKDPDYFSAKKFPKATIKLVKINGEDGTFDLTIKGITKQIKLEVEVAGTSKDQSGKEVIGLSLNGKINRKDFDIAKSTPNAALSDEIKLSIDIEGVEK